MTGERGPVGRHRICVWIAQDLADWLDGEAKVHGNGREVYVEDALRALREQVTRDRANPRPYPFDED